MYIHVNLFLTKKTYMVVRAFHQGRGWLGEGRFFLGTFTVEVENLLGELGGAVCVGGEGVHGCACACMCVYMLYVQHVSVGVNVCMREREREYVHMCTCMYGYVLIKEGDGQITHVRRIRYTRHD